MSVDDIFQILPHGFAPPDFHIVKGPNCDLRLEQQVRKRDNLEGIHIEESPGPNTFYLEMPRDLDEHRTVLIRLKAVRADEVIVNAKEKDAFLDFREYIMSLARTADASQGEKEIKRRLIAGSAPRIFTMFNSYQSPGAGEPAEKTQVDDEMARTQFECVSRTNP